MTEKQKHQQGTEGDEEPIIRSRVFFKENLGLKEPVIINRQNQKS